MEQPVEGGTRQEAFAKQVLPEVEVILPRCGRPGINRYLEASVLLLLAAMERTAQMKTNPATKE